MPLSLQFSCGSGEWLIKNNNQGGQNKNFLFNSSDEISAFTKFIATSPQLGYEMADNLTSADLIIIPGKEKVSEESAKLLYEMVMKGKTVIEFYRFYESTTGKIPVSLIGESWFLENVIELDKRKFEQIKRLIDVILAVLFFIPLALLAPFTALAIKLTSRGSVFYRQKRLGKNGKIFEIIKFRSMTKDAEKEGAQWAQMRDKRVTAVGKFLRKTRLDELPQILSILKGDLSFIGPRPERPEFVSELSQKNTSLSNEAYRQTGTFRLGPDKFPLRLFRGRLNAKAPIRPLLRQKPLLGFGSDYHPQNDNDGFKNRRAISFNFIFEIVLFLRQPFPLPRKSLKTGPA